MKRKLTYYGKNLMLFDRNREWLRSDIEWKHKLLYYPSIVQSYGNMMVGKKKIISYLGKKFVFDNPATPLNLQNYPYEITSKILANMDINPKKVLDIGGNVGQFSMTLWHVLQGDVRIDIFEPNGTVYPLLAENIKGTNNLRAFNYGIGPNTGSSKMYFEPGRSGTGSMLRGNASDNTAAVSEIDVKLIHSVSKKTKNKEYDLIKIDVEGFEMEVLKSLTDLSTNYLFIEMSSGRDRSYVHSEILGVIKKIFGEYDILYCSSIKSTNATFDMLFKFNKRKAGK